VESLGPRTVEELLRRSFLDDYSAVHEDHPIRDPAREAHLVRNHHHGHSGLREVGHNSEHTLDELRIQRRRHFVEEHHFGIHCQRPRNGHPLLLAARELRRPVIGLVGQPNFGSLGASCHVDLELDSQMLREDPDRLRVKIQEAFAVCKQSVDMELAHCEQGAVGQPPLQSTSEQQPAGNSTLLSPTLLNHPCAYAGCMVYRRSGGI
jgi:hypothetical protein